MKTVESIASRVPASLALVAALVAIPLVLISENPPTTKEEQTALSPDAVLAELLEGNARYVAGEPIERDLPKEIKASSGAQYPKAVILSCLDSRVPVEQVFDQGIGDIFVGRVAANIENEDQLGSMEFATKVAGAKLVLVLGHGSCGAVKGACDGVEMGNLTALLAKIKPAVDQTKGFEGERTSKNDEFVARVIEENVRQTVADIRTRSEVLAGLEAQGAIKIVGAIYSLEDGTVSPLK